MRAIQNQVERAEISKDTKEYLNIFLGTSAPRCLISYFGRFVKSSIKPWEGI
jgi:hypothetical protein